MTKEKQLLEFKKQVAKQFTKLKKEELKNPFLQTKKIKVKNVTKNNDKHKMTAVSRRVITERGLIKKIKSEVSLNIDGQQSFYRTKPKD